ncbi:unnamed protein product [Ectocarpus sp. 12 AP-2014]
MSPGSQRIIHFLRHSSMARSGACRAILVARHRCVSSASGDSRFPAPTTGSAAHGVTVTETKAGADDRPGQQGPVKLDLCGEIEDDVGDEEMEEMLQEGPAGKEWGGPTRGGVLGEPTRFGDWERKGRCSDF